MMVFPEDNNTLSNNSIPPTLDSFQNCRILSTYLTPVTQKLLCTMMTPYIAVGFPANLWVVWLIATGAADAFAAELFFLNVALCDLIFMFGIPLNLLCVNNQLGIGFWVMAMLKELWVLVWVGRPLFQCCICLERYLAVIFPLTFIRFKPLRFRVALSGLMWMIILFQLINVSYLTVGEATLPLTSFVIALSIMTFFCLSILWSLKRPGPGETERTRGDHKRRAFNMILLYLAIVLASYGPVMVVLSLKQYMSAYVFFDLSVDTQFLLVFCGVFQPLIYLHKAGKLTYIFKKLYA